MDTFAFTPGAGAYKHYPPYVNLTGNRLTVRGQEDLSGENPQPGPTVWIDLPDDQLALLRGSVMDTDNREMVRRLRAATADPWKLHMPNGPLGLHADICTAVALIEASQLSGVVGERDRLREALTQIRDMEPRIFDGWPADWREQIDACEECQRYASHPIQQGICNEHRRPIWASEKHDRHEREAMHWRMSSLARAALDNTGGQSDE